MGSDSKINLMHTVLSLETGGLERMVAESALAIDKKLFKVDICCFDRLGDFADKLESNGVGVTLLPRNQYQYDYLFPIKLKKLLIENKTHIIHMHTGTFFLGTQASILARTPARIYTEHGRKLVEPKKHLLMDRASAIFVDKIVAVSKELEDFLVSVVKIPHKKTMTIINGIDTNKYTFRAKPLALLKEFGIAENANVVGTV